MVLREERPHRKGELPPPRERKAIAGYILERGPYLIVPYFILPPNKKYEAKTTLDPNK